MWISFGNFEYTALDNGEPDDRMQAARKVFSRAYTILQRRGESGKEERVVLLEASRDFERTNGDAEGLANVEGKMPRAVKKRRRAVDEVTGEESGWEEYYDYIFPDDEAERPNFKLLAIAHQWKQRMAQMQNGGASAVDDAEKDKDDSDEEEDGRAAKRGRWENDDENAQNGSTTDKRHEQGSPDSE